MRYGCVAFTLLVGATLVAGCSGTTGPATAPATPVEQAAPGPAGQLSSDMKAAQSASSAVDKLNAQTGAATEGTP